jgi:hypothetical protein
MKKTEKSRQLLVYKKKARKLLEEIKKTNDELDGIKIQLTGNNLDDDSIKNYWQNRKDSRGKDYIY